MHDQSAAGFLMEVVKEFVLARRERADIDDPFAAGSNDLLDPQRHTLEFHRRRIESFILIDSG